MNWRKLLSATGALSASLGCLAGTAIASEIDEVAVKNVEVAAFNVGSNVATGSLVYVVDRTTGLCFAQVRRSATGASGLGVTLVPCEPLRKIPEIRQFLETGELPGG